MFAKEEKPLISVIVPVCNAAKTLKSCVDSLISQTLGNIEVLLINNGSTDNSLAVCRELASSDNRVKFFDHYEKGVSAARNRGLLESTGDYVMFVDADDWIDSDVCEIFSDLNKLYGYDLFCFSAQYHKRKKRKKIFLFKENIELMNATEKEDLQIKVLSPQAPNLNYRIHERLADKVWGKFYKREILLNNNLRFAPETIISEDCLFNTLALDYFHRIGYTKKCFYHDKLCDDSAQNRYRPNSDKYFTFVIENMQAWLENTGKYQRFIDAANCLFVHYLFGALKEDVFHKDNSQTFEKRKKDFIAILNQVSFRGCLKKYNPKYFSLFERGFLFLVKNKCFVFLRMFFYLYNKTLVYRA